MTKSKRIPAERRPGYWIMFTNGNRGMSLTLSSIDPETGYEARAGEMPLFGICYDPIGTGDDMTISLGKNSPKFNHVVKAPVAFWESHDEKGVADPWSGSWIRTTRKLTLHSVKKPIHYA